MKLYEWDFAPNCRRVRIFLLEKNIDVEKIECITPAIVLKDDYAQKYPHYMCRCSNSTMGPNWAKRWRSGTTSKRSIPSRP